MDDDCAHGCPAANQHAGSTTGPKHASAYSYANGYDDGSAGSTSTFTTVGLALSTSGIRKVCR